MWAERRLEKWDRWSVIWMRPASIAALRERVLWGGGGGVDVVDDGAWRLRLRGGGLMV